MQSASLTDDGSDGQCSFDADSFGAGAHAHRSHIAAAGAVAAAMWHHGRRPALHHMENHLHGTDRDELRAAAFSSMQPMSAPLLAVRPMVQRCWGAIADVAAGLAFGDTIGHAHVCAALGLTDRGGPGSLDLAMIRSGDAPRLMKSENPARAR